MKAAEKPARPELQPAFCRHCREKIRVHPATPLAKHVCQHCSGDHDRLMLGAAGHRVERQRHGLRRTS